MTQEAQAIVPEPVIVPPVIGAVVAIEVTVPPPGTTAGVIPTLALEDCSVTVAVPFVYAEARTLNAMRPLTGHRHDPSAFVGPVLSEVTSENAAHWTARYFVPFGEPSKANTAVYVPVTSTAIEPLFGFNAGACTQECAVEQSDDVALMKSVMDED